MKENQKNQNRNKNKNKNTHNVIHLRGNHENNLITSSEFNQKYDGKKYISHEVFMCHFQATSMKIIIKNRSNDGEKAKINLQLK